jgi:hypothetical protein
MIPSKLVTTATMSSREIAELTGKEHKHVLMDIRRVLAELGIDSAGFSAEYKDATGRTLPAFTLPKRETLILVSGYSVTMRARIIDRWQELEAQVASPAKPAIQRPQMNLLGRPTNLATFPLIPDPRTLPGQAGEQHSQLTLVSVVPEQPFTPYLKHLWKCRCTCKRVFTAALDQVRNGTVQDCGCTARKAEALEAAKGALEAFKTVREHAEIERKDLEDRVESARNDLSVARAAAEAAQGRLHDVLGRTKARMAVLAAEVSKARKALRTADRNAGLKHITARAL